MATKKAAAKKKPAAKKKTAVKAKATSAASKKAPKKKARKLDAAFLKKIKASLEEERATYTRQAAHLRAEADSLAEDMEGDTDFNEEGGEGASTAVERERDLVLSAKAREQVEAIDAALIRVTDKTYGVCTECGSDIPKARLEALPQAALCIDCKTQGFRRR